MQLLPLANKRIRKSNYFFEVFILLSISFLCCNQKAELTPYTFELRKGWPIPLVPDNNPLTVESIVLGRSLFHDSALSIDSTISCASCHIPSNGFADSTSLSLGINGRSGFRNSGALANVAYLPYFNRDGGVKTLDIFASVPIEDHQEMGFNLLLAGQRLSENQNYKFAAKKVYDREFDGFVITRALASYLRTFISDNSFYDQYLDDAKLHPLTETQFRGKQLFFSAKAKCSQCHSGIHFSDFTFQNNGLLFDYANKDRGRQRITLNPEDEGKFRVATLRNIELTSPYMHNGSLPTLKSVLQHYSNHGSNHKNKNPIIDQIQLTDQEEDDIIAFLKTLTDIEFINNPKFTSDKID